MIAVELRGLRVRGHHGAEADERDRGQTFLFDVTYEVGDAALSDRLEDTVDYRDVARIVREVSHKNQFTLIEALAGAVADALLRAHPIDSVTVRVRKPEVELDAPVDWAGVSVERSRS